MKGGGGVSGGERGAARRSHLGAPSLPAGVRAAEAVSARRARSLLASESRRPPLLPPSSSETLRGAQWRAPTHEPCRRGPAMGGSLRVAVLGAPGVGKTAIIRQFLFGDYPERHRPTDGPRLYRPAVLLDGAVYDLSIRDGDGDVPGPSPGGVEVAAPEGRAGACARRRCLCSVHAGAGPRGKGWEEDACVCVSGGPCAPGCPRCQGAAPSLRRCLCLRRLRL